LTSTLAEVWNGAAWAVLIAGGALIFLALAIGGGLRGSRACR
jgi:hypothetical protein